MKEYTNLKDLLSESIVFAAEDQDNYYIRLKPKTKYENAIWKVNKRTELATYMLFTTFLQMEDETRKLDPQVLRRISK